MEELTKAKEWLSNHRETDFSKFAFLVRNGKLHPAYHFEDYMEDELRNNFPSVYDNDNDWNELMNELYK